MDVKKKTLRNQIVAVLLHKKGGYGSIDSHRNSNCSDSGSVIDE